MATAKPVARPFEPASDYELSQHVVPVDVQVGSVVYRQGVPLFQLVAAMRALDRRALLDAEVPSRISETHGAYTQRHRSKEGRGK